MNTHRITHRWLAAAAVVIHFAVPSAQASPPDKTPLGARLDSVISQAVADQRIVGTVVMVAQGGKVVYQRAAGMADREQKRAMTMNTPFRLASVTKPLVAATAMRMVEDGTIGLDDPVTRWLPDFTPRLADGSTPVITIRQLLTHTAGLNYGFLESQDGPLHRAGVSDGLDHPAITLDENMRRLSGVPLVYAPGSSWRYSLAMDVLGAVLARAGGKPLPALVEQYVTGPLQMRQTAFFTTDRQRLAVPYADARPVPKRMAAEATVSFSGASVQFAPARAFDARAYPSGGAGMVGSAPDFMRFLLALRQHGAPILQPATVASMMQDQVGAQATAQRPGWGFGYGWAVLDDPALARTPQAKGTIQWGGVYGHSWFYDPQNDLAVVVFTNTAVAGMAGQYPDDIRNAVYASLGRVGQ